MKRLSPLELSHGVAWCLGALSAVVLMEFGFWPVGLIVMTVAVLARIPIESAAIRAHKRHERAAALDEWFTGGAS